MWGGATALLLLYYCFTTALLLLYYCFTTQVGDEAWWIPAPLKSFTPDVLVYDDTNLLYYCFTSGGDETCWIPALTHAFRFFLLMLYLLTSNTNLPYCFFT
jgi:hypothetical protein